ncbi:unnamed protein product, partial [Brassica oleracea var. botrytis]
MVSFFRHNYIYQISSFSSKNCSYTIDDTVSKDLKIVDSSRILASLIIFCIQLSLLASVFSNLILKSRFGRTCYIMKVDIRRWRRSRVVRFDARLVK